MITTTVIKICGITNVRDAEECVTAGADELGFNFFKGSVRFLEPDTAARIARSLPARVGKVGVFVNESISEILRISGDANLDAIQLHGDEPLEFVSELRSKTKLRLIKAFRVSTELPIELLSRYTVDGFLLDAHSNGSYGGTGEIFDWSVAVRAKTASMPIYLAGGLDDHNVGDAIAKVRPYAVDACSGLESEKGRKDLTKVQEFVRRVRETDGV